jgi:alpha-beta hydrolase superfamily lysophospholipase
MGGSPSYRVRGAAAFPILRVLPLLAAAGLAACTAGPVGGPMPADRADVARGTLPDGLDEPLVMQSWPSRGPTRAVILALHGFGDAGELTFGDAAEYWAKRGISVYAVDQRGFGANASRKRWPGVDKLVADAVDVAGQLRARHPGRPLVVVGHSMGGGVALAAAATGMPADALVLAGPAIAGGDALNPLYRAGGWAAAAVAPERRWTGAGIVEIRPTDNDEAIRRARDDPRHFGDPSSRELYGLVLLMDRAAAAAPAVRIPTLTLMGAHDEVLRPGQVRRVHARIPGGVGFREYPDGWHWLFSDHQAERIWSDVADFALAIGQR